MISVLDTFYPMKTRGSRFPMNRLVSLLIPAGVLGAVLFLSGCATAIKVDSSPQRANVTVAGKSIGVTPTQYTVDNAKKAVDMTFELPGYFPKTIAYTAGPSPQPIFVTLGAMTQGSTYEIKSEPVGATVALDGRTVGTTPMSLPVEFKRDSDTAPWTGQQLAISKADYQTEMLSLNSETRGVPMVRLTLLKDVREYTITATSVEGAPLNAVVTLEGKPVGKTPMKLPINYRRDDKSNAWPKFTVSVELPGQYKPASVELSYERNTTVALKLVAVTEIPVRIFQPVVSLSAVGATFKMEERTTLGVLRTSDDSPAVTELKPVTKVDRQDMLPADRADMIKTINSFTLTPDGQNVIFSQTETNEAGVRYSVLWSKRADDPASGVSNLTSGTRNFDTQPYMANDGGNYLVFTSNRGDYTKSDIFRVNMVEGRIVGGLARLTSDNRFNFWPTYGDSNRQLFYLSMEPAFPKAEPQLSSIRFDGSLPTQLPIVADQINNAHPEKIFFVKTDPEAKKKQIYSITTDGKLETALINDESFRKANCLQPFVSADGQRVLFVSDRTSGARDERPNNNIYIINADGTNLQQLTSNESDDTAPQWSPTEEGVVYFLSTRGGATNIWRFKLISGR